MDWKGVRLGAFAIVLMIATAWAMVGGVQTVGNGLHNFPTPHLAVTAQGVNP